MGLQSRLCGPQSLNDFQFGPLCIKSAGFAGLHQCMSQLLEDAQYLRIIISYHNYPFFLTR